MCSCFGEKNFGGCLLDKDTALQMGYPSCPPHFSFLTLWHCSCPDCFLIQSDFCFIFLTLYCPLPIFIYLCCVFGIGVSLFWKCWYLCHDFLSQLSLRSATYYILIYIIYYIYNIIIQYNIIYTTYIILNNI